MYNVTDINNIINSKKDCIAELGDKICTRVKSGNFFIDSYDITTFETLEYLLSISTSECITNLLIDNVQDICDGCKAVTVTTTTTTTECVENAIISESDKCLVTESNEFIISE